MSIQAHRHRPWLARLIGGSLVLLSCVAMLVAEAGQADKILILKGKRSLQVIQHGQVLAQYRVSLGRQPLGPKLSEGDQRTPEGFYRIDWRQPSRHYQLSLHLSYPNERDLARSRELGLPSGGMIMIHGTPQDQDYPEEYFHTLDWTDGCIALRNQDMRALWKSVRDGTLVEIRP